MKWTTISVLSIGMAGVAVAGQAASLREQVERLIPEQVVAAVRAQADGARDGDAAIEVWGVGLAARRAALLEQFDEATACAWLSEARHRLLAPEPFNVARIAIAYIRQLCAARELGTDHGWSTGAHQRVAC